MEKQPCPNSSEDQPPTLHHKEILGPELKRHVPIDSWPLEPRTSKAPRPRPALLALAASAFVSTLFFSLGARAADRWPMLCVTEGHIGESTSYLSIADPNVRAVAPHSDGKMAELIFTYRGRSSKVRPLASGEVREQLGLKLVAGNGCNLIYVMWRLGSQNRIMVSTKTNPGDYQSEDCGNGGYTNVVPDYAPTVAAPRKGATHALRAVLQEDGQLRVTVNRTLVWRGKVPWKKLRLDGPAGLRSDNVELRVASMGVRNMTSADQIRRSGAALPRCPRLVGPG